jgi:kynurenine formamidase
MKLLDLSHQFYPGMYRSPKFPEMEVEIKVLRAIEKDGINILQISFGNHIATHIDGPRHIIPGGENIDQLPLDLFYGTGVVLNIPKGPKGAVSRDDLKIAQPP